MSYLNRTVTSGRRAWLVDVASILFLATYKVHLWVASRIPTGDMPSETFPGCRARMVDLHFGIGRGRVHCDGDQWWTGFIKALANTFGAHSAPPFFGGSLIELLWLPVLVGLASGWLITRAIRFGVRRIRGIS